MPQPASVHRRADQLISTYERAWRRVLQEQSRMVQNGRPVRARRLEEISRSIAAVMDGLDVATSDWIATEFPRVYLTGLAHGARDVAGEVVWTTIHQRAVEELGYGIYDDLLKATRFVRVSAKDTIRRLARAEGEFALIGGDTAQNAGRALQRALLREGITSVTYRNGARVGLAQYAEMNLRTTTALGYNRGTLNGAAEVVWWEVFDGPNCGWTSHDDINLANGMIVTRDEALSWPIAHPNCRRAFGARPDITSRQHADELGRSPNIGSGQTTFGQRQAQLEQDRARTAAQGRRAARQRRQRRTQTVDDRGVPIASQSGTKIDAFDGKEYPVTKFPTMKQGGQIVRGPVTRENLPAYRAAQKAEKAAAKAAGRPTPVTRTRPPRAPRQARGSTGPARAPQPTVSGVNPRAALSQVPNDASVGSSVQHSLRQIEKVHRVPDGMPQVPVKASRAQTGPYGQYQWMKATPNEGRFAAAAGEAPPRAAGTPHDITIRASGDHKVGTFAHEYGHYLDNQAGFLGDVEMASEHYLTDPLHRSLFDAMDSTETVQNLRRGILRDGSSMPRQHAPNQAYYLDRREMWARSYHQWIATRTQDPTMLRELEGIVREPNVRGLSQWSPEEFGPIADAFDAIFRSRGLLVE